MAFYTGKKKKNSACFEKGRRKKKNNFVRKICGVLKDDLKTNIPIALEANIDLFSVCF